MRTQTEQNERTLEEVAPGERGVILQVGNENGPVKRRLVDMGLTPGTEVTVRKVAPFGDPVELNLRGYELSLRKADAAQIRVATGAEGERRAQTRRRRIGMVLQDAWLFEGTIAENIAYGKPDATLDEVVAAAKAAHADSFIRRLPEGYDTVIAEDGGNISQGQKQLLCIARVMLCLPPMLILDEATSSIDTRTEVRIQKAFARMMQGRTSFIVAHRLSTIREADVILVMKDGHIVEQGNHDELLAAGGFYAKLYNSQFEGVET